MKNSEHDAEENSKASPLQCKRTIAFFLPRLAGGGAERVTVNLLGSMREIGYKPCLVLAEKRGPLLKDVPDDVEIVSLDSTRTLAALVPLVRFLRKTKPEVLVSSLDHNNIISLLACRLSSGNTRLVICQHNAFSREHKPGSWYSALFRTLYRLLWRWADEIVAVSRGVADDLSSFVGIPRNRITVIYNPVITSTFWKSADEYIDHHFFQDESIPVFIVVGRLVPQKDVPTAISAFARFRAIRAGRLVILGEGPLEPELQRLCSQLGVSEDVAFLGYRDNPFPYIKKSSALVLSSIYEGFGNVLVEALAVGTPVISTDCTYGPREILEDGKYGILVPVGDVEALAAAMERVLVSDNNAEALMARANLFTATAIARQYVDLVERGVESCLQ